MKWGHLNKKDLFAVPNTMFVYLSTLKSGHLTNQDTSFCPKGVLIREVPLHIVYEQSFKRCWERQGNNNNTTERQSNTTQLARNSHFSKKNWLPRVGLEPTTISSPGDALTNWATEAAQLAGPNPAYKSQSISTWWTGELKLWYLGEYVQLHGFTVPCC